MDQEAYIVELEQEPIELCNLLKILELTNSGGQAKMLISEGYVALNGEVCLVKRKKVFAGDVVEFNGKFYQLTICDSQPNEMQVEQTPTVKTDFHEPKTPQQSAKTAPAAPQKTKTKKKQKADKATGRKPISFG